MERGGGRGEKRAAASDSAGGKKRRISEESANSSEGNGRDYPTHPEEDFENEAWLNETSREGISDDDSERDENHEGDSGNHDRGREPLPGRRKGEIVPETGYILKIYLENFMCHRKFSISFNHQHNLNFINGKNGSGKSAVAVGLQLCLGSNGLKTGRGRNLREYVQDGATSPCILRVTLENKGEDAFRPEVYGRSITIERKISRTQGSMGYKLSSHNGDVISTKKEELNAMLRCFNIFPDNPCCVLTQEESKLFVKGSAKTKYEYFLKATGLESTKMDIFRRMDNLREARKDFEKVRAGLGSVKARADELEKQLRTIRSLDEYAEKIAQCFAKACWADVQKERVELDKATAKMDLEVKALEAAQKELREMGENGDDDSELYNELEGKVEVLTQQEAQILREVEDKRKDWVNERKGAQLCEVHLQDNEKSRKEHSARLRNVTHQINEQRAKDLENAAKEERAVMEKITECEGRLSSLREEEKEVRGEASKVSEEVRIRDREVFGLQKDVQRMKSDIAGQLNELRLLEQQAGAGANGKLAMFGGQEVLTLRRLISENQRSFTGPVIGPLGMYIKLREGIEEGFNLAIERALGSLVFTFVVTNMQDLYALQRLINQAKCRKSTTTIIRQSDLPRYENMARIPCEGVLTVLDALIIENDLVHNALVDQASIERTILVGSEERDLPRFITRNSRGHDSFLENIASAVAKNGVSVRFANGNRASEAASFPLKGFFSRDTSQVMRTLQESIHGKKQELHATQAHLQEVLRQSAMLKNAIHTATGRIRTLSQHLDRATRQRRELDDELLTVQAAGSVDTSDLEAEQTRLQGLLDRIEVSIAGLKETAERTKGRLDQCKEEHRIAQEQLVAVQRQQQEEKEKLEQIIRKRVDAQNSLRRLEEECARKQRAVDRARSVVDKADAEVKKFIALAEKGSREAFPDWDGEPFPVGRTDTRESLMQKQKKLKLEFEKAKEESGLERGATLEIIERRLQSAQKDYKDKCELFETLERRIEVLDKDTFSRRKRWVTFRQKYSKQVRDDYDRYLQFKGFSGKVQFSHEERTLELIPKTDNQNDVNVNKDASQLSGGERSYTTFCLLLALVNVIECPFRVMDEYDVFLDEITRHQTLEQLKLYALDVNQCGRQFIIITPHSLHCETNNKIKIHYL